MISAKFHFNAPNTKRNFYNKKRACFQFVAQQQAPKLISTLQDLKTNFGENDAVTVIDWAPSWDELDQLVRKRRSEEGIPEPDYEAGPTNYYAKKRTFGKTEKIRVKLYRDFAAWCPYCRSLTFYLEEKQIPYEVETINLVAYGKKKQEYTEKVPSGQLPAIELDGQILIESADIMERLESEGGISDVDLSRPTHDEDFQQRIETAFANLQSSWFTWVPAEEDQQEKMVQAVDDVEKILGEKEGAYIYGKFSLEDIIRTPMLVRLSSLLYFKGFRVRSNKWPNLKRWYETMETKDAYIGTLQDYYQSSHVIEAAFIRFGRDIQFSQNSSLMDDDSNNDIPSIINGKDGTSWHLPLPPLSSTSFEPYIPGENPPFDKIKAAERMVANHESIVKFSSRGCGDGEGGEAVVAPLCNPSAVPKNQQEVDAALRQVVYVLLNDYNTLNIPTEQKGFTVYNNSSAVLGLEYLRDRIGVPKDLRLPAARQLRAHINYVIDHLQNQ